MTLQYTFRVSALESASSRYVRIMTELMMLASCSDKSYLVASSGVYVTSIQMMLCNQWKVYLVARHSFRVATEVKLQLIIKHLFFECLCPIKALSPALHRMSPAYASV